VASGAPLREEPLNLISTETREPSRYIQILEAIAGGASALGEIADKSRIPQTEISKYVRVLEQELDLVQRTYPLLEVKRGKARYSLKDALARFWFRFIRPQLPLLELGQEREVHRNVIEKIDEHVAPTFETIATEHLLLLRNRKKLNFHSLGRWWSRDAEIDLVAVDEKRTTAYFVEAKWTRSPVGPDVLRALRSKADRFQWKKEKRKNVFIVYARSGFKFEPEEDVLLYSLDDITSDLEHA